MRKTKSRLRTEYDKEKVIQRILRRKQIQTKNMISDKSDQEYGTGIQCVEK